MVKGWKKVKYKNITVYYLEELDGGGKDRLNDAFTLTVKELIGKVDTVCEFCSGPGFIGFSLLAHGLCGKLVLVDVNPKAIDAVNITINKNRLKKKVVAYLSDALEGVPKNQKWDLAVSNPPHLDGKRTGRKGEVLLNDPGWQIHKRFYAKVSKHLTEEGSVLFIENGLWSKPKTFKDMIKKNGLTFQKSFPVRFSKFQILKTYCNLFNATRLRKLLTSGGRGLASSYVSSLANDPHFFIWSKKRPS